MADREGNVLKVPGSSVKAEVRGDELLASYARFTQKGVTLKAGQGVLELGTPLARETATKKYVVYNSGGTGGTNVCLGFLRQSADTTGGDLLANIVISGIVKGSKVAATTGGTVPAGVLTDLNGRLDAARDFLIF